MGVGDERTGDTRRTEDVSEKRGMQRKMHKAARDWDCCSSDVTDSLERFPPPISQILNRRLVLIRTTVYYGIAF